MKTSEMLGLLALAGIGYVFLKSEGVISSEYSQGPYPRPMGSNRIANESFIGPLPRPMGTNRISDEFPYYISVDPKRRHRFEITGPISYGQRPPPLQAQISYGQRPPPLQARVPSPSQWPENVDVTPPNYGAKWLLTSY